MKKYVLLSGVAAFGLVTIIVAVAVRARRADPSPAAVSKTHTTAPRRGHYIPPKDPGPQAKDDVIARASSEAVLRTTYKNYRTAIATGNARLRDALLPKLTADLPKAVAWAEEDLARSGKPADIEISRRTLQSLRR